MEVPGDSPHKKKRKIKTLRPKKCIIHLDVIADDATLSAFTKQSWQVNITFKLHRTATIWGNFN
jgi:hypothetical protein